MRDFPVERPPLDPLNLGNAIATRTKDSVSGEISMEGDAMKRGAGRVGCSVGSR